MRNNTLTKKLKTIVLAGALFAFAGVQAQYCVPGMNCTDGDLITHVIFAGIDNPTGCSPNGYGDFTADVAPAEVEAGQSYDMSVEVGTGWMYETVAVYINYDDDPDFMGADYTLIGTGSGEMVEEEIQIPAGTPVGTYRMRVTVLASNEPVEGPCYNDPANYGEFEDYLISVIDPLGTPDVVFANNITIFKSEDLLNIQAGAMLDKVEVFDITGKLIATQQQVNSNNTNLSLRVTNQVILVKVTSTEGYSTVKKVVF